MKKFLIHFAAFLTLSLLFISILVGVEIVVNKGVKLQFVTNSVSFNAKADFLMEHETRLNESDIIVIGSSMSLNNIDCQLIQDSLQTTIVNTAAWGMKLPDYKDFDIWKQDKVIFTNMHFTDFGRSEIKKKAGYPYTFSPVVEYFNIATDIKTYNSCVSDIKTMGSEQGLYSYTNLNFDNTGTVLFPDSNFNKDAKRWESEPCIFSDEERDEIISFIQQQSLRCKKMIICFSPGRRVHYSMFKSQKVREFESRIKSTCPNVVFSNMYDLNMPDEEFVDNCHFNVKGARKYTQLALKQLKPVVITGWQLFTATPTFLKK